MKVDLGQVAHGLAPEALEARGEAFGQLTVLHQQRRKSAFDEQEASGALGAAYDRVAAARGRVANILKVHSVSPQTLTAHLDLYRHLMFGPSELSRREREVIAVAVSAANACHY